MRPGAWSQGRRWPWTMASAGSLGRRLVRAMVGATAMAGTTVLGATAASGQEVDVRAEVGASVRGFPQSPLFGEQASARLSPSLLFVPELEVFVDDRWSVVGQGFVRVDAHDDNRSHADVRELGVLYLGDRFTAFGGVGQAFWGVMEVRHLVDIVNQIDAVEDLDGEDRLGQPMVTATLEGDWGALDLYYLPVFRERTFPHADARLRGPLPVRGDAVYSSGRDRWSPSFAARAFRTMGALDVGLSVFSGTSREPRFQLSSEGDGQPVLQPVYDKIDQIGLDAQWTGESTLWKLEAMARGGHGERIYAVSGGIEHTLYQILGSDGDLGLLAELMLDSRDVGAPPTLFDNDLFIGARWALNDISDTSLLGGPVIDLATGETLIFAEAERRLGSDWRVSLEARLFANADPGSIAYAIRRDGFLSLSLSRFF